MVLVVRFGCEVDYEGDPSSSLRHTYSIATYIHTFTPINMLHWSLKRFPTHGVSKALLLLVCISLGASTLLVAVKPVPLAE